MTHTIPLPASAAPDRDVPGLRKGGKVVLLHPLAGIEPDLPATPRPMAGAFSFAGTSCQPGRQAGLSHPCRQEVSMFEEQPQPVIEALMKSNPEFKQLYQRHKLLDKKVNAAELGVLPIDDVTLGQMKREKLAAKDRLLRLYDPDTSH